MPTSSYDNLEGSILHSNSPDYRLPTSPVSPPPSPELARVLDMAVSLASLHEADDDIPASFESMEWDDAVEERMSHVEPVDWASDKEGSVFDHEVEPVQDAVAQTLRPIIFKSVLTSVIGRDYTGLDIRGFVVSDLVAVMCDMSNTTFVDKIVDDIMDMN